MERVRPGAVMQRVGNYFPARKISFVSTGCTLLDCVVGGGWPGGRIVNVVGDKSVGKSLLAIEACANFHQAYPDGKIYYREAEAAFDLDYASVLGLPASAVNFGPEGIDTVWGTIDDIFDDLEKVVKALEKAKQPGLYIVDSLDALSSRDEIGRDRTKGTYGTGKPKVLSEMFRQLVREFKHTNLTIMFISQVRDKIGVTFGAKYSRTGGRALDFYASVVLYLSHISTLTKTVKGQKRATGVRVKVKCTKNKITVPFRECEFVLRFGFGVDDLAANAHWLKEVGQLKRIGVTGTTDEVVNKYLAGCDKLGDAEYRQEVQTVRSEVIKTWLEVEESFQPTRKKYG